MTHNSPVIDTHPICVCDTVKVYLKRTGTIQVQHNLIVSFIINGHATQNQPHRHRSMRLMQSRSTSNEQEQYNYNTISYSSSSAVVPHKTNLVNIAEFHRICYYSVPCSQ